MIKIAPSVLSADFSCLKEEINKVESFGADMLHIDVMDGHFVPNITMGPFIVKAIRNITKLPLDVHLMIENPLDYIKQFSLAGGDIISFHLEAKSDPESVIKEINKYGKTPAIAVNPDFDIKNLYKYLRSVKMVLLMSVFPGFSGQEFIKDVIPKIKELRDTIKNEKLGIDIEVDGGINDKTSKEAVSNGANILVAGSYIFNSRDYKKSIDSIRNS